MSGSNDPGVLHPAIVEVGQGTVHILCIASAEIDKSTRTAWQRSENRMNYISDYANVPV